MYCPFKQTPPPHTHVLIFSDSFVAGGGGSPRHRPILCRRSFSLNAEDKTIIDEAGAGQSGAPPPLSDAAGRAATAQILRSVAVLGGAAPSDVDDTVESAAMERILYVPDLGKRSRVVLLQAWERSLNRARFDTHRNANACVFLHAAKRMVLLGTTYFYAFRPLKNE